MAIKKYNPVTPGLRTKTTVDYSGISKKKPEKSLIAKLNKSGGRNRTGKMTMRQIGGGHKRRYRVIDFKRDKDGVQGTVDSIQYDPNRSAFIALIEYSDGEKRYIIAPGDLKEGDKVMSGAKATPDVGNALFLSDIPLGLSLIHISEPTRPY